MRVARNSLGLRAGVLKQCPAHKWTGGRRMRFVLLLLAAGRFCKTAPFPVSPLSAGY